MTVSMGAMVDARFLSICGPISSGPWALCTFSFSSIFLTAMAGLLWLTDYEVCNTVIHTVITKRYVDCVPIFVHPYACVSLWCGLRHFYPYSPDSLKDIRYPNPGVTTEKRNSSYCLLTQLPHLPFHPRLTQFCKVNNWCQTWLKFTSSSGMLDSCIHLFLSWYYGKALVLSCNNYI